MNQHNGMGGPTKATKDERKGDKEAKAGKNDTGPARWPVLFVVLVALAYSYLKSTSRSDDVPPSASDNNDHGTEDAFVGERSGMSDQGELLPHEAPVQAFFRNEWGHSVSIKWVNEDDSWIHVIDSVPTDDQVEMGTFVGHRFVFTREGTSDAIGETVEIGPHKNQQTYTLARGTPRRAESDDPCTDRFERRCQRYAADGECEKNPGWMIVNCPKSCKACDLLDSAKRCDRKFLNISEQDSWQPGDLNRMFERVIVDFAEFKPEILSRPPDGPWVVVFHDFIKDIEVNTMIAWGKKLGFARSTDVGQANERGETTKVVSQSRTSSNAWCSHECEVDPLVTAVSNRIERVLEVPQQNYESFQLLQYHIGQEYKVHHDMANSERNEPAGPRILTFFLYLSDVEQGGETHFPKVKNKDNPEGLKVKPRKGSAVLWPSVLDEDPARQDPRTFHAALPVIKGLKYASNHWVHLHDFRKANLWGCTGSFD